MVIEKRVKLDILLNLITLSYKDEWKEYLSNNYDVDKMNKDLFILLDEFLNDYALNNTEKSD